MTHIYALDTRGIEVAEAAEKLAQDIAAPAAADVDTQARFPREAVAALARQGFFGLCTPADCGGQQQSPAVFAAVAEQLSMACPSTAMVYVMHVTAAAAIVASQTLTSRETLLRDIAAGKCLATLAFSERGSRSQFWAPVSQLQAGDGGGWTTSAQKSWVTSANHADVYVCSGQQPGASSPLESTLYLARRDADALNVSGAFNGLGLRGNDSAPVEFANLHVAPDDLLTAQGEGAGAMLQVVLPWFCVGSAAMAHGLCQAALAATQQHLTTASLEHDNSMLRDLPNLRARVAQMSARTQQSRALLGYTVGLLAAPDEQTPLFVLQSRLTALEAALEVTDLAMKACGGAAFSRHLGIEQMFRDARAGWVMAPTVDHLQEFIGRALVGLPLF